MLVHGLFIDWINLIKTKKPHHMMMNEEKATINKNVCFLPSEIVQMSRDKARQPKKYNI